MSSVLAGGGEHHIGGPCHHSCGEPGVSLLHCQNLPDEKSVCPCVMRVCLCPCVGVFVPLCNGGVFVPLCNEGVFVPLCNEGVFVPWCVCALV